MRILHKITLFLNPSSKSFTGKKNWKYFLDKGFKEIISKSGKNFIESVINDENEIAVATGGDGSINMVINGIMCSNKKKILGVLYCGTSPDFCKFHNIPTKPQQALKILLEGKKHLIDICKLTYLNNNEIYYFASSCNIGLGADIAKCTNKMRRYLGEMLGMFVAEIWALLRSKPFEAEVEIDGQCLEFKNVRHIAILKNNFIASGLHVNIEVLPDDGIIYVIVLPKVSLKILANVYRGKIPQGAYVQKCDTVRIRTNPIKQIEFDGDPQKYTPLRVECLKRSLELIK